MHHFVVSDSTFGTRNAASPAMMNKLFLALVALLIATVIQAQPTSGSPDPTAGVEMTGTIKEYTPGIALVLETLAPSEPVHFK
jgi:hypothetical protein